MAASGPSPLRSDVPMTLPPFDGVMGQVAAGLISGTSYRNAPQNFPRGMIRLVLLKGSCGASCAEPIEAADGDEVAVAEVGFRHLECLMLVQLLIIQSM